MTQTINIKPDTGGVVPSNAHEGDFAYDVRINEDVVISPGLLSATLVPTGLHTAFDENEYGMILAPRSSISKLPLAFSNSFGIVEGTYRGDIMLPLRNTHHHYVGEFVPHAITYNGETKTLERVPLEEIPAGTLQKAKKDYIDQIELKHDNTLSDSLKEAIFVTIVPTGTVFLPKHYRVGQLFLTPKVDVEFNVVKELPDSERGTGGFGSSGVD